MDSIPRHMRIASLWILDELAVRRWIHGRGLSLRKSLFSDESGREKEEDEEEEEEEEDIEGKERGLQ